MKYKNKHKYIQILVFTIFFSGCTSIYSYKQVTTDACSQINAKVIERQHSLTNYYVHSNTCTIVYTEDYKIYTIAPVYPQDALENGIEGDVYIKFIITSDGSIINPKIISSTHPEIFNDAAIMTIQLWRFEAISKRARLGGIEARQKMHFRRNKSYILQIDPHLNFL